MLAIVPNKLSGFCALAIVRPDDTAAVISIDNVIAATTVALVNFLSWVFVLVIVTI
jgi:hypothetical protein